MPKPPAHCAAGARPPTPHGRLFFAGRLIQGDLGPGRGHAERLSESVEALVAARRYPDVHQRFGLVEGSKDVRDPVDLRQHLASLLARPLPRWSQVMPRVVRRIGW
ncbi:hypothetical protein GCM10009780_20140 [Actinomadura alba]